MKKLLALVGFLSLLAAPVLAANCSPYPYTLSNGQVADANQVMANFNNVLNCGNNNLAHNGANSDITSLSGLLTPITQAQGGTGNTSGAASTLSPGGTIGITGDIVYTSPTFTGSSVTAAATLPVVNANVGTFANATVTVNAKGLVTAVTAGAVAVTAAEFRDSEASGTGSGESLPATTWTQRNVNTTVQNGISGASLSAKQITLPAGTYVFTASSSAQASSGAIVFVSRLRNVTAGSTISVSSGSSPAQSSVGNATTSWSGVFTLAGAQVLEIDTYPSQTATGGSAISSGEQEIYSDIVFEKIA